MKLRVGNRNSLLPIEETVIFQGNQCHKLTPMVRLGIGISSYKRTEYSAKRFEVTRTLCYDVSGVERRYQFLLQCLQSDAHVAADNFRGYRAPLPLGQSAGK